MLSLSLKQIAQQLHQGKLSATELCERSLQRIRQMRQLNAFITETPDIAREQAAQSDTRIQTGRCPGLLDGIPVAVKDNFSTAGIQTTCGSHILQGYIPPYNASVVQKLLDQGAVLMGKTNMDEFGMGCGTIDSLAGPARSPWKYEVKSHAREKSRKGKKQQPMVNSCQQTARQLHNRSLTHMGLSSPDEGEDWFVVGGSSGGSAIAVATGMAFGALGSDTGGSTRNPASFCGVVGLKPTYGRLSRHGLIPLVNSMDVPGILARSIDDAVVILNVLSGHDPLDSTTVQDTFLPVELPDNIDVKGLHIGIPKEYHAPGMLDDTLNIWNRVADMFERAGAKVTSVSLPHTQYSIVCYHVLCACEVASNMARYDGIEFGHRASDESSTEALFAATRHEGFNYVVRGRILAGNYFLLRSQHYDKYYTQALKVRRLIAEDFERIFADGIDLLLTPTLMGDSPLYSKFRLEDNRTRTQEQDVFTQPANLAGVPAVAVPSTLSSNGLPIGLQLLGQPFQEQTMLLAAKWMEQQLNFPVLKLNHLDSTDS